MVLTFPVPADPVRALAEWSRDVLRVPPGHPMAGRPMEVYRTSRRTSYGPAGARMSRLCALPERTRRVRLLSASETRALLDGIDLSTLAGLRDRALLGVLVYSFARVSAAVSMRVADYYTQGPRSFFRLHEKGGRYNVVPAHHTAQAYVDAYLAAAGIAEDRRGPLFRPCPSGRNDALLDRPMTRTTALKMIKRRAHQAELPREICAHSFRGTGITEYLRNGGDLEVAARIAGHESTRTTQLYNRLHEEISLDEIERIHI